MSNTDGNKKNLISSLILGKELNINLILYDINKKVRYQIEALRLPAEARSSISKQLAAVAILLKERNKKKWFELVQ